MADDDEAITVIRVNQKMKEKGCPVNNSGEKAETVTTNAANVVVNLALGLFCLGKMKGHWRCTPLFWLSQKPRQWPGFSLEINQLYLIATT
jgi:hypothetical protein